MANDNILDATGMFMTESIDMKHCIGLIFKSVVVLFQWKDFESSDTDDLFISLIILYIYVCVNACNYIPILF